MSYKVNKNHLEKLVEISKNSINDDFESIYAKWLEFLPEESLSNKSSSIVSTTQKSSLTISKYPKDRDTSKDESVPISQRMFTHPQGHLIGYTRAKMLGLV